MTIKNGSHWEPSKLCLYYATTPTTKQMIAQTMMNAKSAYVTFFKMLAFVLSLFLPKYVSDTPVIAPTFSFVPFCIKTMTIIAIEAIIINIINAIATAFLTSAGIEPPGVLLMKLSAERSVLKNELSILYVQKIIYVIFA
jgi:hypothetical protein